MVEPTRKRPKGNLANNLSPDSPREQRETEDDGSRWIAGPFDLAELAVGAEGPKKGGANWGGGFKGRPVLTNELVPYVKLYYGGINPSRKWNILSALRAYWRLFDKYNDVAPVNSISDLDDVHGAMQMRDGMYAAYTDVFLRLANAARVKAGMAQLFWPRMEPPKTVLSDAPTLREIRPVYHALKHRVQSTLRRWEEADALATSGKSFDGVPRNCLRGVAYTIGDVHATYRALAKRLKNPCPTVDECRVALGMQYTKPTYHVPEVVAGLFPTRSDLQWILYLFLLRTGWNAAVALEINVESLSQWYRPHPTSPSHHIVYSVKRRGNTEQIAIGLEKSSLSPGNLIKALLARSEPLRQKLREELVELRAASNQKDQTERINKLQRMIRSPWIFADTRHYNAIKEIGIQYSWGAGSAPVLRGLISEINNSDALDPPIPAMTLSEFRDAYISFAYANSGYSWLVAQLAAGHSSIETLRTYLRKRRWKADGQHKVGKFSNFLWSEIENRRVVDPAILFGLVQRGEVTEEQRVRWIAFKDRTRLGMGCKNFYHPPRYIAPDHVPGTGCRVPRCTLCEYGIVFEDSLDHLARRKAELAYLKTRLPLTTWFESSFSDEFEATVITLERLFDPDVVKARVEFWAEEIRTGRHRPFDMEGEYGPPETR